MLTASMSTVAWRRPALEQMLPTILPQVERLNVFLQGYDAVPDCLRDPRVVVVDGRDQPAWLALKSTAKLFWIAQGLVEPGIHLTVDDDIAYPEHYVAGCAAAIDRFERRAVVGYHGAIYGPDVRHLYRDRREWHFEKACEAELAVHTLGTGVIAWHTSTLRLTPEDLPDWDAIDFRIAIAAQRQRVPMICLGRPAGYLKALQLADDPRACSGRDDYLERMVAFQRSHSPWVVYPLAGELGLRERPVVVVVPCFNEQPDRIVRSVESALAVPGVDMVRVVDDGSPVRVELELERTEVLRRPTNGGPSAALNAGIRTLPADAIVCRLDVGDVYIPAPKARQIELVRSGAARAAFSWHYDPVRDFIRKPDVGWRKALFCDNQFGSTTGVWTREVWAEIGGFDDTMRWTDDWRFAMWLEWLVGWTEFEEVTGEHGMFPGGHSDVAADPARKAAREVDMLRSVELGRALGNPRMSAHLFNPRWCAKRGIKPLALPTHRRIT